MAKVSVTYIAPEGDNKVVETHGLTLYHGQTVDLDTEEHDRFLAKAEGNPHFLVGDQTADDPVAGDEVKKRRGRPPKAEEPKIDEQ